MISDNIDRSSFEHHGRQVTDMKQNYICSLTSNDALQTLQLIGILWTVGINHVGGRTDGHAKTVNIKQSE
jgi:hypothetical protein